MNVPRLPLLALLALLAGGSIGMAVGPARDATDDARLDRDWRDYGGSPDQSKFVETDLLTPENVSDLEVAWFYPSDDENRYQFNPLIVDSVMYVLAKDNSLVALNAVTGEELWIHAHLRGIARRGINYWESADGSDRRLLFQMNDYLQAIDARTGQSILSFGENGLVDLRNGLDRDPSAVARVQSATPGKIFENLIILGSSPGEIYGSAPGHVRAYDVVTGEHVWTFRTIPHPGEFGYETWPKEAYRYVGGANVWGELTVDAERGIVFLPTGSPTYDYYGADRLGSNLFGNSIVALNARTGERLWHFQTVHHDLWDYDAAAAPQLITIRKDGREIDAVAVATKHGFLYVFDRETGEPVWPIEEMPVPPSHMPGDEAWPTQPVPTVVPPFARQNMTSEDLTPFLLTEEERAAWTAKIDSLEAAGRTGLFVPLSDRHETLSLPGAVGGASWGNTAADPGHGIVYVYSIDWPSFYPRLELRDASTGPAPSTSSNPIFRGREVFEQNCQVCHSGGASVVGSAPSLAGLERRLDLDGFRQIVRSGQGEMPAFPHLDDSAVQAIYRFLGGSPNGEVVQPPDGPVVASGGAPGGQTPRAVSSRGGRLGPPYPEGIDVPPHRYYLTGWGLGHAYVIRPPWSTLTAYDLNRGVIKWQRPVGLDRDAAAEGGTNTGVPQAQRNGMIVTSSGIVFSTAKDGKIYAFDAEDGDILWSGDLPTGTEGLPSYYEIDGRPYIVVTATTPLVFGRSDDDEPPPPDQPRPQGGYVVFSLPK